MENESIIRLMEYCNNYFAVLYERVSGASVDAERVTAPFVGRYSQGDIVRIHGAYNGTYEAMGAGECYTVQGFENGILTLDRPLHTRAPYLLVAYCEPSATFATLSEDVAEYVAKAKSRAGLQSESIGGYSYSVASDAGNWQKLFADDLAGYRVEAPTRLYYLRGALAWQ